MLRKLAALLAALSGARYEGAAMAAAVWRQEAGRAEEEPHLCVRQDRHGLLCAVCAGGSASLEVTLLLGTGVAGRGTVAGGGQEAGLARAWTRFSVADVRAFTAAVGDGNALHRGSRPVVPGLLLLERLRRDAGLSSARRISLRFLRPALADEPLFWQACGAGRLAIGDGAGETLLVGTYAMQGKG